CHLNTCPVGIATQDPELRRRFAGEPEHVVRFFTFLAESVRHELARLGVRSLADLVGRWELLRVRVVVVSAKVASLDFAPLIDPVALPGGLARRCEAERNVWPPPDAPTLDGELAAAVGAWLEAGATVDLSFAAPVHD